MYTYDMQTKCANTVDEILLSQRERPAHVNKIICEAPCVPGCCCYGDVISMSLSVGSVLLFLSMPISAFTYATYHCTALSDTTSGGWWKVPISARVWWMDGWMDGLWVAMGKLLRELIYWMAGSTGIRAYRTRKKTRQREIKSQPASQWVSESAIQLGLPTKGIRAFVRSSRLHHGFVPQNTKALNPFDTPCLLL